jgi:hypothetical protein
MRFKRGIALAAVGSAAVAGAGLTAAVAPAMAASHHGSSFIGGFKHTKLIGSTVPKNGDVNPYGVAVVQRSQGRLVKGSVLVSNFNNSKNLQGTGTTIVQVSPGGKRTVFAQVTRKSLPGRCPGGIGLTTALVIAHGWVIVGDLPSKDGSASTASGGCLLVINNNGVVRKIFRGHGIRGPWDATAASRGNMTWLFVSNVLNGTIEANGKVVHRGTVLRLAISFAHGQLPAIQSVTKVGSGFAEQTNASAFVLGPTGLGLGRYGALYVADTKTNQITWIANATTRNSSGGTGTILTEGGFLNAPLGLTIAPNGDVLTVNGGNGRIVEVTPGGTQFARFIDRSGSPPGAGALFGLAVAPHGSGIYYVDDAQNTLRLLS